MKSLDEIAIECGTDKSSKGHNYCQYYEMFFDKLRDAPNNLLEIGVDKGDSIRMWQRYFPNTKIHGIDLRGDYEYLYDSRTQTHIVDQSSRGQLILFASQFDEHYFNIIIDDGSHMSSDMILTFETLFPFLRPGGYYVIEDLLCDYDERWNKDESVLDRIAAMIYEVNMNGNIPNDQICANKQEAVKKFKGSYMDKNIEWIFQACGIVIIKKI